MAVTLRDFIRALPLEEQDAITKRAFELRAGRADLDAFDRIMNRETRAPDREADHLDERPDA